MLNEQTMSKLFAMKLNGMAEAYEEQRAQSRMSDISFEERLALLVERQWLWKENRSLDLPPFTNPDWMRVSPQV